MKVERRRRVPKRTAREAVESARGPPAGAPDDQQAVGLGEQLGGDLCRRADDQRMRPLDQLRQAVEIELHVDLVAGGDEPVETTFGDRFGDQDAGHGHHRYRRCAVDENALTFRSQISCRTIGQSGDGRG